MEWIKIDKIEDVPKTTKLLVWIQPNDKNIPGYTDMGMVIFNKWKLTTNDHMENNVTHYIDVDKRNSPDSHEKTLSRNALYKSILDQEDKTMSKRVYELKKLLNDNS